jgi:hypothetical protein
MSNERPSTIAELREAIIDHIEHGAPPPYLMPKAVLEIIDLIRPDLAADQ